jgi:hypothetical protein
MSHKSITKKSLDRLAEIETERKALMDILNADRNVHAESISKSDIIKKFAETTAMLNHTVSTDFENVRVTFKVLPDGHATKGDGKTTTRSGQSITVTDRDTGKTYTGTREEILKEYTRPNGEKFKYFKSFKTKMSDKDKTQLKFEITV